MWQYFLRAALPCARPTASKDEILQKEKMKNENEKADTKVASSVLLLQQYQK